MSRSQVTMKLLIDKHTNKVIYAEAGKDCVDFLFHVFMLPVGAAMNHLVKDKDSSVNAFSLANLFKSVGEFSPVYLQDDVSKSSFLNPKVRPPASSVVPLWTTSDLAEAPARKPVYVCPHATTDDKSHVAHECCISGYRSKYYTDVDYAFCYHCKIRMNKCLTYLDPPVDNANTKQTQPGYVKGQVMYMITDNLVVKPLSSNSTIALLVALNVKDVGCIKETNVTLDTNKGMALLKASLTSNTVLTDTFLAKKVE